MLQDWKFASNQRVGLEVNGITGHRWWGPSNDEAFAVLDPTFFGNVAPLPQGSTSEYCIRTVGSAIGRGPCALAGPTSSFLTVVNPRFLDYQNAAVRPCGQACTGREGGHEVRLQGATWPGLAPSTARVHFHADHMHSNRVYDVDGSVSGTGQASWLVGPEPIGTAAGVWAGLLPDQGRRLGHLPADACEERLDLGGLRCDAAIVSLRSFQFRSPNSPLNGGPGVKVQTAHGWTRAPFSQLDSWGRLHAYLFTVAMRPKTLGAETHTLSFPGKAEELTSWERGELWEARADEWAVLEIKSTVLGNHYDTKAMAEFPTHTNNYVKTGDNSATFDSGWAGFSFDNHKAGDWAYVPNLANAGNIGMGGSFKMLLSGKSLADGSAALEWAGPHTCDDGAGGTDTRCSIVSTFPCPYSNCLPYQQHKPGGSFGALEACKAVCQSFNSAATGCRGIMLTTQRKKCYLLIVDWPGPKDMNEHYRHVPGQSVAATIHSRTMPAQHCKNQDMELWAGTNEMPVCESAAIEDFPHDEATPVPGLTPVVCTRTPVQDYPFAKHDCPSASFPCTQLSTAAADEVRYPFLTPPLRSVTAEFTWCTNNPADEDGNPYGWTVPRNGEDVVIKEGWTVILDETCTRTNKVANVAIYGELKVVDRGTELERPSIRMFAKSIVVGPKTGKFTVGTAASPFLGRFVLNMYGTTADVQNKHPYSNVRRKAILVFGILSMHGGTKPRWTRLVADALRGSTTIDVAIPAADLGLWVGQNEDNRWKKVLIAPSTHDWSQTEHIEVTGSSQLSDGVYRMTLRNALQHDHLGPRGGDAAGVPGTEVATEGDTNIEIRASDSGDGNLPSNELGTHIGVHEVDQVPDQEPVYQGTALLDGVKFVGCGQGAAGGGQGLAPCLHFEGTYNAETIFDQAGLALPAGTLAPFRGAAMYVKDCLFWQSHGAALSVTRDRTWLQSPNLNSLGEGAVVTGNVVAQVLNNEAGLPAVKVVGKGMSVRGNLVLDVRDKGLAGVPAGGGLLVADHGDAEGTAFSGNAAAGIEASYGLHFNGFPCEWYKTARADAFKDNVAHSSAIGLEVSTNGRTAASPLHAGQAATETRAPATTYPGSTRCGAVAQHTVYATSSYGVVGADLTGTFWAGQMLIYDASLAFASWHENGNPASRRSGPRNMHSKVVDSVVVGDNARCANHGVAPATFYGTVNRITPSAQRNGPSYYGGTVVESVEFRGFGACPGGGRNYALVSSVGAGSLSEHFHDDVLSIEVRGLVFTASVEAASRVRFDALPGTTAMGDAVADKTCAQMECDGKRNALFLDRDGSLTQGAAGTLVPMHEVDWTVNLGYTDAEGRATVGELVPTAMRWRYKDTSQTAPLAFVPGVYDFPGISRKGCTKVEGDATASGGMPFYSCPGGRHRHILLQSLDSDFVTRRVGPVGLRTYDEAGHRQGNRYMTLYTGPAAYGVHWDGTIRSRVSAFLLTGEHGPRTRSTSPRSRRRSWRCRSATRPRRRRCTSPSSTGRRIPSRSTSAGGAKRPSPRRRARTPQPRPWTQPTRRGRPATGTTTSSRARWS